MRFLEIHGLRVCYKGPGSDDRDAAAIGEQVVSAFQRAPVIDIMAGDVDAMGIDELHRRAFTGGGHRHQLARHKRPRRHHEVEPEQARRRRLAQGNLAVHAGFDVFQVTRFEVVGAEPLEHGNLLRCFAKPSQGLCQSIIMS